MLPAMTLAEALGTTRIHRVAGRTGESMAFVTVGSAPHSFAYGSDRLYAIADDPCAFTAGD